MPADDIRAIELRRLHELERQAAQLGPQTDPAILIEIQDLHTKYPGAPRNGQRTTAQTEMDFLMNAVAAGLSRITLVEQRQAHADQHRRQLDRKLDALLCGVGDLRRWVQIGGIGLAVALAIAFVLAVVVF